MFVKASNPNRSKVLGMLTLFSIPKPFAGHIGMVQRNAIQSWIRLHPQVEVILFADEEGTADVAQALGVRYVPDVARNKYGTPLLNGLFETAQDLATHSILCYVNADIILMSNFVAALRHIPSEPFLLVGQCWALDVTELINFDLPDWEHGLRQRVATAGRPRGPAAVDYFLFRRGQLPTISPFAVGRHLWDNWMIYRMHLARAIVIDATASITAVHQNHDYSHIASGVPGGTSCYGPEADMNRALARSMVYPFTINHATRVLTDRGLARPPLTRYCVARSAIVRCRLIGLRNCLLDQTRPIRHRLGLRRDAWRRFKARFRR